MTRAEFLNELRIALQGNVSQAQVNAHLAYYENYIMEESRKGKTEEQVIAELGDPRLIARTLMTVEGEQRKAEASSRNKVKFRVLIAAAGVLLIALLVLFFIGRVMLFLLPVIIPVILLFLVLAFIFQRKG